jgi:hypothetical protein
VTRVSNYRRREALYAFACLLPLLLVLGVGTWALQQRYHPHACTVTRSDR